MKETKSLIGWCAVIIMLMFWAFCAWDFVTMKIQEYDRRLAALEQEARPLFVVDRYSHVYLNGKEIPIDGDEDDDQMH